MIMSLATKNKRGEKIEKKNLLIKAFSKEDKVMQCYDDKGNYKYSVLYIYARLSGKCGNFFRIKYNADECEICVKIDKTIKK